MPQTPCLSAALAVVAMLLIPPPAALAQPAPAGIVTALQGPATVVRTATRQPTPLKFRDDVFLHDRIRTGDHALVRLLLGGRATVTVREHCLLTITDDPRAAQVRIGAGRASVAAVKSRMRAGEIIEIVTPHSQATIRGTVVIAEVSGHESTFTVIRGLVDVSALDPTSRRPVGAVVHLGPLQQVTVSATGIVRARTLTPAEARALARQFTIGPGQGPVAAHESATEAYVRAAIADLAAIVGSPPAAPGGTDRDGDRSVGAVVTSAVPSSQPASAAASPTTTSAVTTAVTGPVAPIVTAATSAVAPVASAVAPIVTAATNVVAPALTSTVAPVITAVAPVVSPVVTATTTLISPVTNAATPVVSAVTPVVSPVVTTVAPVASPVVGVVTTTLPVAASTPLATPPSPTTTQGLLGTAATLTQGLLRK